MTLINKDSGIQSLEKIEVQLLHLGSAWTRCYMIKWIVIVLLWLFFCSTNSIMMVVPSCPASHSVALYLEEKVYYLALYNIKFLDRNTAPIMSDVHFKSVYEMVLLILVIVPSKVKSSAISTAIILSKSWSAASLCTKYKSHYTLRLACCVKFSVLHWTPPVLVKVFRITITGSFLLTHLKNWPHM